MELKLYTFSKRSNSTKTPADADAHSVNVQLKENTSLYSPSFLLTGDPTGYNYAKWNNKYYYISDYVYEGRNLYTISCTLDVLASFKSAILATTAFVIYSTSNYDVNIPDTRLSLKNEVDYTTNSATLKYNTGSSLTHEIRSSGGGYYCVTYTGQPINSVVPETVVCLTSEGFRQLCTTINSSSLAEYFATGWFNKLLNNATSCVSNVRFVPLACHEIELEPDAVLKGELILGGNYQTGITSYKPKANAKYNATITIPWQHSDFRNGSNYTALFCHLPGIGVVNLNADLYYGLTNLTVTAYVDENSGDITYDIAGIERYTTNVSRPITISAENRDIGGTLSSVASSVMSIASSDAKNAIRSAYNAAASTFTRNGGTIGGTGQGLSNYYIDTTLKIESACHNTTIEPSAMATQYGRPCNKVISLANLTGYCQTTDAHVTTGASEEINDTINNLLNGGIYIE